MKSKEEKYICLLSQITKSVQKIKYESVKSGTSHLSIFSNVSRMNERHMHEFS